VVNTPLVELEACRIEPWLMTLKLLVVEPADGGSSWFRMSVTSVCAALSCPRDLAWTVIELIEP